MGIVAQEYDIGRFVQHRFGLESTTRAVDARANLFDIAADFAHPLVVKFSSIALHSKWFKNYSSMIALKSVHGLPALSY